MFLASPNSTWSLTADCGNWQGLVYDYYVDEATATMVPWADRVPKFSYMPGSFATLFVPTVESTRLTYFLDQPHP